MGTSQKREAAILQNGLISLIQKEKMDNKFRPQFVPKLIFSPQ